MKTFRFVFVVLIAAVTLAACASPATPTEAAPVAPKTTLTISGAGGTASILKYLAEAYSEQHSDLAFEFLSGSGTSGGVKGVLDGTLDIGTMSRLPKDAELADGIEYLGFGTDRIALVTSADLSVSAVTSQQAKDLFVGNLTNWSEVGGPDHSVNVFVRDEEESSTQILRDQLFEDTAFASGSVVFTSEGEMRDALSDATNTIAFLSYGSMRLNDMKVHALTIDKQDPANLDSDYPYFRPLGIAYLPSNAAKMQSFLDFIASPEAQALLAEQGIGLPE